METDLVSFGSALVAAVLALVGNYWLQQGVSRRRQAAGEFKKWLYKSMDLFAEYWGSTKLTLNSRGVLEAKIVAFVHFLLAERNILKNFSKKLKVWVEDTEPEILELVKTVTFFSAARKPDPERITKAAALIAELISTLDKACNPQGPVGWVRARRKGG